MITEKSKAIEELVTEFQEGEASAFDKIYKLLSLERQKAFSILRRSLHISFSDAECFALYDDAVLTAVTHYKKGTALFTTYLFAILENSRITAFRYSTARKRNFIAQFYSMNTVDASGNCMLNQLADSAALQSVEFLAGDHYISLLKEFSAISNRNKLNAILIAVALRDYQTALEKYDYMRELTKLTASDIALQKRVQRAKKDFIVFLQRKAA